VPSEARVPDEITRHYKTLASRNGHG